MRFSDYHVVATTLSNLYENNFYKTLVEKYEYEDIMVRDEHQTCCYSSDAYKGYCYFHIDEYKDKNGTKLSDEAKKVIKYKVYKHEVYERVKWFFVLLFFIPILGFSYGFLHESGANIAWSIFGACFITFISVVPFAMCTGKHYDKDE